MNIFIKITSYFHVTVQNQNAQHKTKNLLLFILFSSLDDNCGSSVALLLVIILDLTIKLSSLFMEAIMGFSSPSCPFLVPSIDHYLPASPIVMIYHQLNTTTAALTFSFEG